jgi:hypothetical protein
MIPGNKVSTGTLTVALGLVNASSIFFSQLFMKKRREHKESEMNIFCFIVICLNY